METKRIIIPAEFKDTGEGTFTGYGNVTGIIDCASERTMPGAFRRDLQTRGSRRPLLWSHMPTEPIGTVDLLEDARGLRVVKGQLVLEVQRARELYALLKTPGAIGGMSIGYNVERERTASDGVRELLDVSTWEVSLVAFPCNRESTIESVKQCGEEIVALRQMMGTLRRLNHESRRQCTSGEPFTGMDRAIRSFAASLEKESS